MNDKDKERYAYNLHSVTKSFADALSKEIMNTDMKKAKKDRLIAHLYFRMGEVYGTINKIIMEED
jgi:hypothetical protein